MAQTTNIGRTFGDSVTQVLPKTVRQRREEKALAIIKAIPAREEPEPELEPYVPPKPDPTYTFWGYPNDTPLPNSIVYFMYSANRIKIGFSTGLRGRHNGLKKAGAFPPVVLMIRAGGEKLEREYHKRFAEDRLHGEWFSLSPKLRSFLRLWLCDTGLASLEAAEAEFHSYCFSIVENYRPPPKRKESVLCQHGKRPHHHCVACERKRDLKTLEGLSSKDSPTLT